MEELREMISTVLIVLLFVSIASSLFTTFDRSAITGYVTGSVNASISEDNTINLSDAFINFPSGYVVNNTGTYAILVSNGTCMNWSAACSDDYFLIENMGNVNLNVSFNASVNATGFLCNETGDCISGTESFGYWAINSEASSCSNGLVGSDSDPEDISGNETKQLVCEALQYASTGDTIKFYIYLHVPKDSYGKKRAMFTFYASKSVS